MPVPKRKRSRARRDSRFANKGLKVQAFSACLQCQEPVAPHQACKHCGYYKGKKVLTNTKGERSLKRVAQMQKKQEQKAASTSETPQE